ncbi:MAG: diguanylate cyclase [Spirochaetales bacterium]|nr:diguanylate cyclase [Spirochaetales bacterium]
MNMVSVTLLTISIISLYIAAFFTTLHVILHKNRIYLNFALLALSISLYQLFTALLYSSSIPEISIWYQRAQFSTIALINLAAWIFFIKEEKRHFKKTDILIIVTNILFAIIPLIPGNLTLSVHRVHEKSLSFFAKPFTIYESKPGIAIIIECIFVLTCITLIFVKVILITTKQKKYVKFPSIFSLAIFIAAIINDILIALNIINSAYIVEYTLFVILLLINFNLQRKFYIVFKREKKLHHELEEKVEERSKEISELNKKLSKTNAELSKKNNLFKRLAEKDGLTGLLNHANFQERLDELVNMSQRHNFTLSVAMIDVDDFKKINDTYGHQTGDELLKTVSSLFKISLNRKNIACDDKNIRSYDIAGRYGGDEFGIILPYCDTDGIKKVFERIYSQLEIIGVEGYDGDISISVGAVSSENFKSADGKELVRYADEALYLAKKKGKNRYFIYNWIHEPNKEPRDD